MGHCIFARLLYYARVFGTSFIIPLAISWSPSVTSVTRVERASVVIGERSPTKGTFHGKFGRGR